MFDEITQPSVWRMAAIAMVCFVAIIVVAGYLGDTEAIAVVATNK